MNEGSDLHGDVHPLLDRIDRGDRGPTVRPGSFHDPAQDLHEQVLGGRRAFEDPRRRSVVHRDIQPRGVERRMEEPFAELDDPEVLRDPEEPLGFRRLEPVQPVRRELDELLLAQGPPALETEQERDGESHVLRGTTSQKSTIVPRPGVAEPTSAFGARPAKRASPSGASPRRFRGKSPVSSTTRAVSNPISRNRRRRSSGGTSFMVFEAHSLPRAKSKSGTRFSVRSLASSSSSIPR